MYAPTVEEKRRRMYHRSNNNGNGPYIPLSTFFAPLRTSIVPQRGVGSATFTRATTATVTDHEGLIRRVKSGEARFHGARRVQNLVQKSEDLTAVATPGWGAGISGAVITATTITFTNNNSDVRWTADAGMALNTKGKFRVSFDIWGDTTQLTPELLDNSDGSDPTTITITVTATRTRYSFIADFSGSATFSGVLGFYLNRFSSIATPGAVVNYTNIQIEDVTGQANQNPSEYVSNGALSAPYHGANVDGVKYFDTTNGNTVASNVVTEATGTPISASTLLGFRAEGARTNLCLRSQEFGTAPWVAGAGTTVTADQATAPDGTVTADKIEANAGVGKILTQSLGAVAATNLTYSIYVKKGSGATDANKFHIYDNTAVASVAASSFNYDTGVLTVTLGAGSVDTLANGWYRIKLTTVAFTSGDSITVYACFIGDAETTGEYAYVWGAQAEAGVSFASTYQPTTSASVARNVDVLTYPTGNISGALGTAYAEVTQAIIAIGSNPRYISDTGAVGSGPIVVADTTGNPRYYDGLNFGGGVGLGSVAVAAPPSKVGSRWSGSSANAFLDGVQGTSASFDGDMGVAAMQIMGYNGNAEHPFGTIRNVRIWFQRLSDSQVKAL